MSILAELFEFLGARKKFWLLPLLVLFLIFGGLVLGVSAFYHDSAAAVSRAADAQLNPYPAAAK